MKTKIITCAFVLSASLLAAQTENKPVKVRIKKVENINGVEKITDTTFTTNDPSSINMGDDNIQVIGSGEGKTMIVNSHSDGSTASSSLKMIKKGEAMDEEIEKALREAGVDPNAKGAQKVVIVKNNETTGGAKANGKTMTKIVIVKTGVNDASPEECKKAGIPESKDKLVIEDMTCTPNPSNGKFNLRFSGAGKSSVDVTVKDINGKAIYTETVRQFNGSYDKDISLDAASKGMYFVTITQGSKSATKKVVVE